MAELWITGALVLLALAYSLRHMLGRLRKGSCGCGSRSGNTCQACQGVCPNPGRTGRRVHCSLQ